MEKLLYFIETYILIPQTHAASERLTALLGRVNDQVLNPLIILMFSVALVLFILGVIKLIGNSDDASKLEEGKQNVLWGIVGMAIMISVFGIMNFITSTIGVDNVAPDSDADVSGLFQR